MPTNDVTNPGIVNVSDQADGPTSVNQCVTTGPSQSSGPLVSGSGAGPAVGVAADQAVTVGPSTVGKTTVSGGSEVSGSGVPSDTTENTVVEQTYGTTAAAFTPNVYP